MCGRYSLTSTIDQLLPRLKGPLPEGFLDHYQPRQQVRPGDPLLIQRQQQGLPEVGYALSADSETVSQKPFFRGPWRHHRCLLLADGFYGWRPSPEGEGHGPKGKKQPYWIRRQDGAPFWLGGLWDHWSSPDGSSLDTCCILTTTPNALLRPIHDRMPVVIMNGWEEALLLPEAAAELRGLKALMAPWDPAGWEAIPVDWL